MTNDGVPDKVVWSREYRDTEIEFVCHPDGSIYLAFNWNGTYVWEYVGHAGMKRFPNWLRRVADQIERGL